MPNYLPYMTMQRCSRTDCHLTVRLITPIDHCPRCQADMDTVAAPERDFEALIAAATIDMIDGFESLLSERPAPVDFSIRLDPSSPALCRDCLQQ